MAEALKFVDIAGLLQAVGALAPLPVAMNPSAVISDIKAEDSPHVSADIGSFSLGVRSAASPVARTDTPSDYSPITVDAEGKLITLPFADPTYSWQATGSKIDTTDFVAKASAGATLRNYITDLTLSNSSAAAVVVNIKDGATILNSVLVPATGTVALRFSVPLRGSVNSAVNIAAVTAVTTLLINAQGYIGI